MTAITMKNETNYFLKAVPYRIRKNYPKPFFLDTFACIFFNLIFWIRYRIR